jgi:WD40 repeat protein
LWNVPIPEDYFSQYEALPRPPDGKTLYVPVHRTRSIRLTKEGRPATRVEVDGEIQLWDLTTGRKLPPLRHAPPRGPSGVALSADGLWLASVETRVDDSGTRTRDVLTLWDVGARTARDLAEGRMIPSFSPDGKTLAASVVDPETKRKALSLWDVAGGKQSAILHSGAAYYGVPAFSPDGRYVAIELNMPQGKAPEVKLWEVATGKEVGGFSAPEKALAFQRLAFSPEGLRLATTTMAEGKAYLYDVRAGKLLWVRDLGKHALLRDPAFSPDGKRLAIPGQQIPEGVRNPLNENPLELPQPQLFLFDLTADGEPEVVVAPHGLVGRAAFSPDGRTLALGGSGCVWLFHLQK